MKNVKRLERVIRKHGLEKVCEYFNITPRHMKENLLTGKSNINMVILVAIENMA
ncbi:hypothetical protein [Flyfo podovirus Tbat2_2]|nr:hypothetical protein [Flyfo podovirus Tbat2_2]